MRCGVHGAILALSGPSGKLCKDRLFFGATIEGMSLATAWNEQFNADAKFEAEALHAWCSVQPNPSDWREWFSTMPTTAQAPWGPAIMAALGQDENLWESFLTGAAQSSPYKDNPIALLDHLRIKPTPTGKALGPLPLGCLEAMAQILPIASPRWKQQLLMRTPDYWFDEPRKMDPLGIEPLHRVGVQLLCGSEMPAKRLPSLAWSPSALYDDYGRAPEALQSLLAPIQHALEYAVYMHQMQNEPDPLAHVELHGYFQKYNIDLPTFETLVDLSQATPTLGSYIRVLHKMLSPEHEQYHLDLSDDSPQP